MAMLFCSALPIASEFVTTTRDSNLKRLNSTAPLPSPGANGDRALHKFHSSKNSIRRNGNSNISESQSQQAPISIPSGAAEIESECSKIDSGRRNLSSPLKPLLVSVMSALLYFGGSHSFAAQFAARFPFHFEDASGQGNAQAAGLFQMPPSKLNNWYYLVRSGESEFESKGIIKTNPVAKTSIDSGLSEKGKKQAVKAALELKAMGACEANCWIWPSITQRAYQAAEIIASVNTVSRSRIVPEYSFLDARGLGAYEGRGLKFINEVYASDLLSPNLRPPPFTDGTPNESVTDVFVRITQLMSILETQYSSENVIIVSPDSDNLTILQAGLTGLDLRRHADLSFSPGEVRLVDISSIPARKQPPSGIFKCLNPPSCT